MKILYLSILTVLFFSCKKPEEVTPVQKSTTTEEKAYYTYRIEAVSDQDVIIRYSISKNNATPSKGGLLTYSLYETKDFKDAPVKTWIYEDTIRKQNQLNIGVYNKLVSDPNKINVKVYLDGVLVFEKYTNLASIIINNGKVE